MTQEIKDQITKIIKEHYEAIDILRLADLDLRIKAHKIQEEFPAIYKKLQEAKMLPKSITFEVFVEIGTVMLQNSFQEAVVSQTFARFL